MTDKGPSGKGRTAEFRDCFLPPLPEARQAVSLFDEAADAILANELTLAEDLIVQADIPALGEFVQLVMGSTKEHIHRYRDVPDAPPTVTKHGQRMPGAGPTREIFKRDGWRCRFCGIEVISSQARSRLHVLFPAAIRWDKRDRGKHQGLLALHASLDHVLPYSRGGDNNPENLVTACYPCQFGRNQWTLEEVCLNDPRERAPIVDRWDGLNRIVRR